VFTLVTLLVFGGHGTVIAPASDGGVWLVDRQNDQLWLDRGGALSSRQVDGWPQQVALDAQGNPVVTCREAKTLVRLSADGGLDRLTLPGSPGPMAIEPARALAAVGLHDAMKLVLVDLDAWTIAREVPLPAAAADVVLSDDGWGYALLGERGSLLRFELGGDGGVTEVVAGSARGRGVQLSQRPNSVVAIVRVTGDEVVVHEEGSVRDLAFKVTDTRVSGRWKYYHRVVPGGLALGAKSMVAFDDGTVAELGISLENTARDLRAPWRLEGFVAQGQQWLAFSPTQRAIVTLGSDDVHYTSTNPGWVEVRQVRKLPDGTRTNELLRGERLFSIESFATSAYGFSCQTCHPEGGSDGLRWRFKGRKTAVPTLVARETTRDAAWLQRHAVLLGGEGFAANEVEALLRYVREGFRQRP
jgi:hypothetical protein